METRGYTYSIDPVTFRVTIFCFEGDHKTEEHSIGNSFESSIMLSSKEDAIQTAEKTIEQLKQQHEQLRLAQEQMLTQEVTQEQQVITESSKLSKYAFYTRFTIDELTTLYELSKTDTKLAVFIKLLDAADEIDLNNEILQSALMYMGTMDILTTDRINQILTSI